MASVHARARLSGSVAADRGIARAPNAIEAATIRKVHTVGFLSVRYCVHRPDQHWIRGIDHEQGVGDYKPTVRAAVGHILLGLFSFRNTEQPSAAQARRSHVDSEDTSHLGNSGDADGLGDNSNPSLYFALPSFGVFSGGVTNACSGVGLNAEACSRIFDCYLLFRSGGLYQPASWRCPKLDVVQREIGSDRLFQRLVPLFRGENGRPSRRISEGHDSQLQLENDRSPDLPQLRTSTKRSRRLRR